MNVSYSGSYKLTMNGAWWEERWERAVNGQKKKARVRENNGGIKRESSRNRKI